MHIAFLSPEYPHSSVVHAAGIGTSIKNLAAALVKERVTVSVFVYGQNKDEIFWDEGIKIHLIKGRKYPLFGWFLHRKFIQNYLNAFVVEEGINLIEAPDWTGITAFMKFTVPLVIRFHGSDTYFCHLEKRKQKRKNFWFEKIAVEGATAFIAPTSFAGQVSKKLFDIKEKKIQTIHYGLDLPKFHNANPLDFERGMILYMGTIIRKKGVLELADIFRKVRENYADVQLVLIGSEASDIQTKSNSTWELVQKQFQDQGLEIPTYLGKIPYEQVQQYIKKAQVCLFPTFAETLGMVTIESMALQKAVVNSNFGWAQELIVDQESGFLAHPKDHSGFAERIVALLENENLCATVGKAARKRVETVFDIQKIVKQNIDFYKSIIDNV